MHEAEKQDWRDAYHLAVGLVGKRGIETSLLAVGMMFQQSLDKNLEKWLTRIQLIGKGGKSGV